MPTPTPLTDGGRHDSFPKNNLYSVKLKPDEPRATSNIFQMLAAEFAERCQRPFRFLKKWAVQPKPEFFHSPPTKPHC